MAGKFVNLFNGFFESEKVAGLLLVICTIISLVVANSSFGEGYIHFMHQKVDLSFANVSLSYSVEHWVNDGLMAIFFLMVGLEVERELYVGELADFKKAILPLGAALGGICIPALIHFTLNSGTPTQSGFAIPMATDIAFALGILALAGNTLLFTPYQCGSFMVLRPSPVPIFCFVQCQQGDKCNYTGPVILAAAAVSRNHFNSPSAG